MIKSMTAFASKEAIFGPYTINCELRSVNHRYSDIFLKTTETLRFAEPKLRSEITGKLKRGKIECVINYKKQSQQNIAFEINQAAVTSLLQVTSDIEQQMQNPASISALDVLQFPGIQQEPKLDQDAIEAQVLQLVRDALNEMLAMRSREGEQLGILIAERCEQMTTLVHEAGQRIPEVLSHLRTKLNTRIKELCVEPDFDRLEQELVILAQKLDIDEELDRLNTHIEEVQRVLTKNEPIGRRLDFLMQEMNREANTLGSKSADKEMTRISIELKVLIEQMREQIQNIE